MKDPVCGMEVKEDSPKYEYKGQEYHFCCATCRWAFEQDPEQFVET